MRLSLKEIKYCAIEAKLSSSLDFFLQARVARLQVLRLFWCPRDLCLYIYIYICLSALEDIMPFIHVVLEECTP